MQADKLQLISVGYGNTVVAQRIIAVIAPDSSPVKRLREEALSAGKLIDATQGRKTRAIIVTDSDHVILSALQPETLAQRFYENDGENPVLEETEMKGRRKK
jgi:extracellular matrix regulatory protein A